MIANKARPEIATVYLIVLRHVLAGQDIAQTIRDAIPQAQVLICQTETEARAALHCVQSVALSFVFADPSHFTASGFHQELQARGSRIVLMGDEAEASGATAEWEVLPWPFNTAAIIALL